MLRSKTAAICAACTECPCTVDRAEARFFRNDTDLALDPAISGQRAAVSGWRALQLGYQHTCYCENFNEIAHGVGEIQQVKVRCPATLPRDYTGVAGTSHFEIFDFDEL